MKTLKNALPILICLLTMNISPTFANDDISTTVVGNGRFGSSFSSSACLGSIPSSIASYCQ